MTETEKQAVRNPLGNLEKTLADLQQKITDGNRLDATVLLESAQGHLKQIRELVGKPGHKNSGINPVTFTGKVSTNGEPIKLTVARLWIGTKASAAHGSHRHGKGVPEQEDIIKNLTVMVWKEDGNKQPVPLATMVMDEDHFVRGLGALFPNFELLAATPPDQAEVQLMSFLHSLGNL